MPVIAPETTIELNQQQWLIFAGMSIKPSATCLLLFCILFPMVFCCNTNAQENVITAGVQFKPIFSSKFFETGPSESVDNNVKFNLKPGGGYCVGMVIRKGITNRISFESGINYVKRNYDLSITDSSNNRESDFSIIGYEIPLQGLVFIQLSDYIFMDAALGVSLDFYPSDIRTYDTYFNHYSARRSWFSPGLLANLGWEYRTEKIGYFYIGASYHRPFEYTYFSFIMYPDDKIPLAQSKTELQGNYLTVDFRYFFHSDPQKRKKKIRKEDKRTK